MCNKYLFIFLLIHGVLSEECVRYYFEDYYDLFTTNVAQCNNLASWSQGAYDEVIEAPNDKSEWFITPSNALSCTASFDITMMPGALVEVNVYLETVDSDNMIVTLLHRTAAGAHPAVGTTSLIGARKGWEVITVRNSLTGNQPFIGYIAFMGTATADSVVIVDSFRYIPLSMNPDEECILYDNTQTTTDTTLTTTDTTLSTTDTTLTTTDTTLTTTDTTLTTTDTTLTTTDTTLSTTDTTLTTTDTTPTTTDTTLTTTDTTLSTTDTTLTTTDTTLTTTDTTLTTTDTTLTTTDTTLSTTDTTLTTTDTTLTTTDTTLTTTDTTLTTTDTTLTPTDTTLTTTDTTLTTTDTTLTTTDTTLTTTDTTLTAMDTTLTTTDTTLTATDTTLTTTDSTLTTTDTTPTTINTTPTTTTTTTTPTPPINGSSFWTPLTITLTVLISVTILAIVAAFSYYLGSLAALRKVKVDDDYIDNVPQIFPRVTRVYSDINVNPYTTRP